MLLSLALLAGESNVNFTAITLSTVVVMIFMSVIIPAITALATRFDAHPLVKFVLTLLVSTVTSLINTALTMEGTAVISKEALVLAAVQFAGAIIMYLSAYKPNNADARISPFKGLRLVRDPYVEEEQRGFVKRGAVVVGRRAA